MTERPEDTGGKVLSFPRMPRPFIASLVTQCPALGVIADRLCEVPDDSRPVAECVLAEAFVRLLYLPRVAREDAEVLLDLGPDPVARVDEELALLALDPDRAPLRTAWNWIWEREEDGPMRTWARYCVAAMARLYRLEHLAVR